MEDSALAFAHALNEPVEFTLHVEPTSSLSFPVDRNGDVTIVYTGKLYRFKRELVKYSALLQKLIDKDGHLDNFQLSCEYDYEAFNTVMKLIFGIRDVAILDRKVMAVYAVIEEMGVDNDNGFQAHMEQHIIQKLEKNGDFMRQAYEISKKLSNERIKRKCVEVVNMTIPEKKGPDVIMVQNKVFAVEYPQAEPQSIVEQVDDMFETPKGMYLQKLVFTMLMVYSMAVVSFSLLEGSPRNVKFVDHGAYQMGKLVCNEGFEVYREFCVSSKNETLSKMIIDWAQEINGLLAMRNGIARCSQDSEFKTVFNWDDIKKKLIEVNVHSDKNVDSMLDHSKKAFDYYFNNLRSTGIIKGNSYATSDEVFPSPTCHVKIALSNHPYLSLFTVALIALELMLVIRLFAPMPLNTLIRRKPVIKDKLKLS